MRATLRNYNTSINSDEVFSNSHFLFLKLPLLNNRKQEQKETDRGEKDRLKEKTLIEREVVRVLLRQYLLTRQRKAQIPSVSS